MESKLSLSPIGSKEKAKSIIDKFNKLDYFFVSLKCKGIFKLGPTILRRVFPEFEFSWSNIFVNGYGKTGLSGIVIIDMDKQQTMYQLLELTGGVFLSSEFSVRYKIIQYNVFRSAVLNCQVTSSYRVQTKLSPDSKSIKCQSQTATTSKSNKLDDGLKDVQPPAASKVKAKVKQPIQSKQPTQSKQPNNISQKKESISKEKPVESNGKVKSKQSKEKDKPKEPNGNENTLQIKTEEHPMQLSIFPQAYQGDVTPINFANGNSTHELSIPLRVNKIIQLSIALQTVPKPTQDVIVIEDDQMVTDELPPLVIDEEASVIGGSPVPMEIEDRFIPITLQTIRYALKLLDKLNTRKRAIYVVYHPMFRDSRVSMSSVREVLEPVFDEIEADSVFVKSSLTMLEPTLKEAYSKNFSLCGLAYIISNENLSKNSLAARANEHRIVYGTMTLSCLLTSINKGNYLMSREALLSLGAPVESVTDY